MHDDVIRPQELKCYRKVRVGDGMQFEMSTT